MYCKGYYGTGNSNAFSVHKSIYGRMLLRPEIDLGKSVLKKHYRTGNSNAYSMHKSIYGRMYLRPEIDLVKVY